MNYIQKKIIEFYKIMLIKILRRLILSLSFDNKSFIISISLIATALQSTDIWNYKKISLKYLNSNIIEILKIKLHLKYEYLNIIETCKIKYYLKYLKMNMIEKFEFKFHSNIII